MRCELGLAEIHRAIWRVPGMETQPPFTTSASKVLLCTTERCANFVSEKMSWALAAPMLPAFSIGPWMMGLPSEPKERARCLSSAPPRAVCSLDLPQMLP